ncbi:MAG: DUF1330 domain-containing protein [Pseudomonadota bacterium]
MPKGYWIGHVEVSDPTEYEKYRQANAAVLEKYGAKFLVRGGNQEVHEGQQKARSVVIEFKDFETAKACYLSPEYQHAKTFRDPVATGDLIIIEGYDA